MKKEYVNIKLTGVNADLPPHELPPDIWSDCRNVRFHDLSAEQVRGWSQVFGTPLNPPQWLLPIDVGASYYWIYAGASNVCVTDMTSHYGITPTAGVTAGLDDNWNGGVLNGVAVMNNAHDEPIWWSGSTSSAMTTLTNWPSGSTCKILQPYKNFLIALNMDTSAGLYDNMVKWSDQADPGTIPTSWDETDATKDAGEHTLSDTNGEIVAGKQLGEDFYIYKFNSVYLMRYIGGRWIFSFKKVFDTFGAINQDCIVSVGHKHIVFGDGDIISHDGNTAESILDRIMRNWVFDNIDPTYYGRSFILPYYEKDELWFCFPTSSSLADIALVWNYKSNKFSVRDIPDTRYMATGNISATESLDWDSDSEAWNDDLTTWNERIYSPMKDGVLVTDKDSNSIAITDESFTSSHDVAVSLAHSNLDTTVDPVVTSSDGLTTYTEGTDYTIDDTNGTITVLSTGSMADATNYLIDYSYIAGYLYQMDISDLFDDTTFSAYMERLSMPMLDLEKRKLITRVWPKITATPGTELRMRFGVQDKPTDPVNWSTSKTFTVGTDEKVDVLINGKYLSARVEVIGQTFWRLHSFDVEVQTAGKY